MIEKPGDSRKGGSGLRLFIAIPLDGALRAAVQSVQDDFRRCGVRGNYTKAENLHLTLAFIGEHPDADGVLEVLDAVPFAPFELRLEGIGAFGDLWWLGIQRSAALEAYVRRLRRALAAAGIPFDRKRFSPHITLVRRADRDGRDMPGFAVPEAGMRVEHIALMRSDRGRDGMIYTEIESGRRV